MSSIIFNYHFDDSESIIINKNRGWVNHIDVIQKYITPDVKIICTYREPLEVVSSFMKLLKDNNFPEGNVLDKEGLDTDYKRCRFLLDSSILRESAINMLNGLRNYPDCILLLKYDDLVTAPEDVVRKIYNFLGEESYAHTFELNPKNTVNDDVYKLKNMHFVRSKIKKQSIDPKHILPAEIISEYTSDEFYKNFMRVVHEASCKI
jgi:sulfotransferase